MHFVTRLCPGKNAVLYVINNQRFPKWYYSYDTSVTRTQREMTHHLAAYVFRFTGGQAPPGQQQAVTVLARHASPPFTLVSYRRVGGSRPNGCMLPALGEPSGTTSTMDVDTGVNPNPSISAFAPSSQHDHPARSPLSLASILAPLPTVAALDEDKSKAESDALFWHMDPSVRQAGVAEKAQHLIILWRFMDLVTLVDVDFCMVQLDSHIRWHWLTVAKALSTSPNHLVEELEELTASFSRELFKIQQNSQPISTPSDSTRFSCQDQTLLRACAYLLMRAFSSRTIHQLIQSAFVEGGEVPGQLQLRGNFIRLISDLYDALGQLLAYIPSELDMEQDSALVTSFNSIPALVDDVLSLVYARHQRFSSLRPEVSALLMDKQTPSALSLALSDAFGIFTAQSRERAIATTRREHEPLQWSLTWDQGAASSHNLWNQRWLLEPGSIRLFATADDPQCSSCEPSLIELAHWLHEFTCVDMLVQDDATCCSVRSALTMTNEVAPMQLVLDGRLRVFRVLPSGLSSMAVSSGPWALGDYAAIFSDDDMRVLEMRFYLWAEPKPQTLGARNHAHSELGREHVSVVDEGVTLMRRISLTLTLDEDEQRGVDEAALLASSDGIFVFIHGAIDDATYVTPETGALDPSKFAELPSDTRAAILTELQWTQVLEMQAGYVVAASTAPWPTGDE